MDEILNYFVICLGVVLVIFGIITFLMARRDKHFALALLLIEVSAFVAMSTFGQVPLSRLVLTVAGAETSLEIAPSDAPDYFYATIVLLGCGVIALMFMILRTWDRRV